MKYCNVKIKTGNRRGGFRYRKMQNRYADFEYTYNSVIKPDNFFSYKKILRIFAENKTFIVPLKSFLYIGNGDIGCTCKELKRYFNIFVLSNEQVYIHKSYIPILREKWNM